MSGTDFIFSDSNKYSLYKKGKSNETIQVDELNLDSLVRFIKAQNIDLGKDINNLKVKIHNECGRDHAKPLKFYLDFIEDDEQYCLIDCIWHKFNQSYVEYLKEEVDKIDFNYNPDFDISPEVQEAQFNEERVRDGYVNYDTVLTSIDGRYKVEN